MERPKGKKEKGLPGDSLYIYCNYPRVCPVHGTRPIRQLQPEGSILFESNAVRFVPPDVLQQDLSRSGFPVRFQKQLHLTR